MVLRRRGGHEGVQLHPRPRAGSARVVRSNHGPRSLRPRCPLRRHPGRAYRLQRSPGPSGSLCRSESAGPHQSSPGREVVRRNVGSDGLLRQQPVRRGCRAGSGLAAHLQRSEPAQCAGCENHPGPFNRREPRLRGRRRGTQRGAHADSRRPRDGMESNHALQRFDPLLRPPGPGPWKPGQLLPAQPQQRSSSPRGPHSTLPLDRQLADLESGGPRGVHRLLPRQRHRRDAGEPWAPDRRGHDQRFAGGRRAGRGLERIRPLFDAPCGPGRGPLESGSDLLQGDLGGAHRSARVRCNGRNGHRTPAAAADLHERLQRHGGGSGQRQHPVRRDGRRDLQAPPGHRSRSILRHLLQG